MVLDDASSNGSVDFSDDAPASDSDPYSSSDPDPAIKIDTTKFPEPIPILGPLLGYNRQFLSQTVNNRIGAATKLIQRPVTDEEATAIAYWTAKQISVNSYGSPVGVAFGAWRAYSTAGTFRFPFFQPDLETFKTQVWPASSRALLSGTRAVMAWHGTRLLSYGLVGNYIGRLFFASYSLSVASVGELSDPRLKDWVQEVRRAAQTAAGRLPNGARQSVDDVSERDEVSLRKAHDHDTGDDASPTIAGYGNTDSNDLSTINGNGVVNNHKGKNDSRSSPHPGPTENSAGIFPMETQAPGFDDNFDDASPTAGRGMENTGRAGGSTWDRIRRQAGTQPAGTRGSSQPAGQGRETSRSNQNARRSEGESPGEERRGGTRQRRPASPTEDGFSFSPSEEERQLARDEAQSEFDARVDQERKGGNFSSNGGDQKRW